MASGPDLFVICKNCGAEVSPYITECPYCGNRLRKRAPKLDKGGKPKPPRASRRAKASLPRLRPGEIPGIKVRSGRPYATIALVLAAIVVTLGYEATVWSAGELILLGDPGDEYWRLLTTSFVYDSTAYMIAALGAIFLFGWLLERRHGAWAVLLVYLASAAAGFALVAYVQEDLATGGNAPAFGLLAAWAMRDVLARRRGDEDDSDLLGVLVIAAVLVLLPLPIHEASGLAGLGGGVAGILLGLVLARVRER
jgi:membrane associated rhomboid family serine protease